MASTLDYEAKRRERRVLNNLYLFRDFGYERIEKDNKVYFYKQINPAIGCLIYYFNNQNKDYYDQGFDLFIYASTNSEDAIDSNQGANICEEAKFEIKCFHTEKQSHLSCFIELDTEKKTTISQIDKKYMKEYHDRILKDRYHLY